MKVLVTGGAGFIASAVCCHLIATGCAVVNVDTLTYAANLAPIADSPLYRFHKLDICDRKGLEAVFNRKQPNAAIHLAAESHVDRSISESAAFIATNVVGSYQLLGVARCYGERPPARRRDVFRFLHV